MPTEDEKRGYISRMIPATEASSTNLFETSQVDPDSDTGYSSRSVSMTLLAETILKKLLFTTELKTPSKNIINAINDAYNHGGGGGVDGSVEYLENFPVYLDRTIKVTIDDVALYFTSEPEAGDYRTIRVLVGSSDSRTFPSEAEEVFTLNGNIFEIEGYNLNAIYNMLLGQNLKSTAFDTQFYFSEGQGVDEDGKFIADEDSARSVYIDISKYAGDEVTVITRDSSKLLLHYYTESFEYISTEEADVSDEWVDVEVPDNAKYLVAEEDASDYHYFNINAYEGLPVLPSVETIIALAKKGGGDVPENVVTSETMDDNLIWLGTKAEYDALDEETKATKNLFITIDEPYADMSENAAGGVDVTIGDKTATLAKQSDLMLSIPFEGSSGDVTANNGTNFYVNYSLPSGYEPIGAVVNSTNGLNMFVFWIMSVSNTQVRIGTFNHRTSTANLTVSGNVIARRVS